MRSILVRWLLVAGSSLLAGLTSPQAANCPTIAFGPVPFGAKTVPGISFTSSPDAAAVGDFNRDKKLDVVYCTSSAVFCILGDGNGGLGAASNVVNVAATSVKVADFNQDSIPDLVLGTATVNVRVALGNGDGSFKPAVSYPASATTTVGASLVATGDFNGDGLLDIAATLTAASSIGILPGRGDGTFGAAQVVAATQPNQSLITADFNGDGFLDLGTTIGGGQIAVLINRGNGTFLASTNTPVFATLGFNVWSLRAADLNGDGIQDLTAVSVPGSAQKAFVSYLGVGNGTFTLKSQKPITATALYNTAPTDINGDGRLDVLVASFTTLTVMEGLGDGSFADPLAFAVSSAGTVVSGDLNADGRPDAVVFAGGNALRILLNETEFLPPIPELGWRLTTGSPRLVWYTNYAGYALEFRPSLNAADPWQPVTTPPTVIDCQYFFSVPPNQSGIYRLAKP